MSASPTLAKFLSTKTLDHEQMGFQTRVAFVHSFHLDQGGNSLELEARSGLFEREKFENFPGENGVRFGRNGRDVFGRKKAAKAEKSLEHKSH